MKPIIGLVLAIFAALPLSAQELRKIEVTVEGVARFALVHAPPQNGQPAPLVFAWHGHDGSVQNSTRTFGIHRLWPDAVVVYPEGIPTPGRTDREGAQTTVWIYSLRRHITLVMEGNAQLQERDTFTSCDAQAGGSAASCHGMAQI